MTRDEAARLALTLRSLFATQLEEARPGATFETLPLCAHCGSPPAPNLIGGILCLSRTGEIVEPHAVRVRAWRRELEKAPTAADNLCEAVRAAGMAIRCSKCGHFIETGDVRDHVCPERRPS